eukprot:UC4_evm2s575
MHLKQETGHFCRRKIWSSFGLWPSPHFVGLDTLSIVPHSGKASSDAKSSLVQGRSVTGVGAVVGDGVLHVPHRIGQKSLTSGSVSHIFWESMLQVLGSAWAKQLLGDAVGDSVEDTAWCAIGVGDMVGEVLGVALGCVVGEVVGFGVSRAVGVVVGAAVAGAVRVRVFRDQPPLQDCHQLLVPSAALMSLVTIEGSV